MSHNQTIDGVPRELLENFASYAEGSASGEVQQWVNKLRALLDAPAKLPMIDAHNERLIASLRKRVKEMEAAQRKIDPVVSGWQLDSFDEKLDGTDPTDSSTLSNHDVAQLVRAVRTLQARQMTEPAAQPHGEPVDDCETFEYQLDMLGPIDRCNVSCGSYGDKYHQWDDAGPYVEYEDHVKHIELYKREVDRLSKL